MTEGPSSSVPGQANSSKESQTTLRTLQRGLQVLDLIARSPAPLTMRAITDQLGLNTTTTYHLVNTLRAGGYLERDPSGLVRFGPAVGSLAVAYGRSDSPHAASLRVVEQLSLRTGETAYYAVAEPTGVAIRSVIEGTKSLRVAGLAIGFVGDEHRRASGKAVLAYLTEEERDAMLRPRLGLSREEFSTFLAGLDSEFEVIRARGTAFDDEEFEPGICCVSAPFFDAAGRARGAIALSGPSVRGDTLFSEYADLTREAAAEVSTLYGGRT